MKKGFSLLELLVVMAAMFTIMGVSGALLVQAFGFQRSSGQYSDGMRAVDRFVADFRRDIHVYGQPEIPPDSDTLLRWNTGTETVVYTTQPGLFPDQQTIVRTVRKDDRRSVETYRLPDRMALWFENGKDADAGLVALSLWTTPQGGEAPNPDSLNPFDRTMPQFLGSLKGIGNWRTIIARY